MDNSKRNVHNSGPLGMLMKSGQVKKVEETEEGHVESAVVEEPSTSKNIGGSYFKTKSGIEFSESELVYVDPNECEPWKYANRQEDELGKMDELIDSIRESKQLQPALVRLHPTPHDGIKYEVIFGRRRHLACLQLGIPFLVIRKNIPTLEEALAAQDAENKFRNDVSNYSNAMIYKKLIEDGVFASERELAKKLRISSSSMNDLMAFTKIPADIISQIPNIHSLSVSFAVKIFSLSNQSKKYQKLLVELAPQIGTNTISSPVRLEKLVTAVSKKIAKEEVQTKSKQFKTSDGQKLFTFKYDQRGSVSMVINKELSPILDFDALCQSLQLALEDQITNSDALN